MGEDFVSIIYYFKFVYLVQDLFFETGEIEILDLYGLYHIWGKCNIWYSMVIKRTDFKYFHLICMETITKRIRLRFLYLFLCVFVILKIFCKFYTFGIDSLKIDTKTAYLLEMRFFVSIIVLSQQVSLPQW